MSALTAIINWGGQPVERAVLDAANRCMHYRCPDGDWVWLDGAVGLAQADLATLPEDQPGVACELHGVRIAASCRIDNRAELRSALPTLPLDPHSPDAMYILAAYLAWGEMCVNHLIGDFAFVIWDARQRQLFAARDTSGVRPLFFYRDQRRLVIASERTQILQDPQLPMEIDEAQIIEFLTPTFYYFSGWDQAMFKGMAVLKPGWCLLARAGRVAAQQFWQVRDAPIDSRTEQDILDEYLHTLEEAVRCRLRSRNNIVGMELSGGLDSTALVCLAARMAGPQAPSIHTLSMVFDELIQIDERPRMQAVIERHPHLQPHFLPADDLHGLAFLEPNWSPQSILGLYELTALASGDPMRLLVQQTGTRIVFSGDMGDSLNDGAHRVHYDLLRRGQIGTLWRQLRDDRRRMGLRGAVGALAGFGLLPLTPWPVLRLGLLGLDWYEGKYFSLPKSLNPTLRTEIEATDRTLRRMRATNEHVRCPVTRWTLREMRHPMIACTVPPPAPFEMRLPYCDRRLVELVLGMPQAMKWQRNAPEGEKPSRYHHRRALAGILPDTVRHKNPVTSFSAAIDRSMVSRQLLTWFDSSPTAYIAERGYVNAAQFRAQLANLSTPRNHLTPLLCLEGWLRALAPGGAFQRLVPARINGGVLA